MLKVRFWAQVSQNRHRILRPHKYICAFLSNSELNWNCMFCMQCVVLVTFIRVEAIGSCRGELLERLQEKRESLWEKWETEDSKLEGGWRSWRWWSGRPFADSVGLGADCPAHRPRGVSQASSQESVSWVSGYNNGQPTLTRLQWRVSKLLLLILVCNEKWVVMWCRPD